MSCGNAHEIPCTEIMTAMLLMIDNETSAIERTIVVHHLQECPPCQKEYDSSVIVKSLVARSCGGQLAPEPIRTRVWTEITQIQLEISRGFLK